MVSVLLPSNYLNFEQHLAGVLSSGSLQSFDLHVVDFLDAFSKSVLLDSATRRFPEMAAVAHWMRKSHILKLRADFEQMRGERIWLARGVALHFAPSNVDSIFLYSWFLSMLAGNANIVRLSFRRNEQGDLFLARLNLLLEQERFVAIRDRTLLLSYEHNDALTRKLSESCHLRVLWGGDESVRRLRSIPMNPLASEVVFPNRFSLGVLNALEVIRLDQEELQNLAARFSNDAYWFDQMACSSPRLVAWVGSPANCISAQRRFWPQLERELANRGVEYAEVIGVNKLVSSYGAAAGGFVDRIHSGVIGPAGRMHLAESASADFRRIECGGGLFFEKEISDLHQLASFLTEKDQTLSYFGFSRGDLENLSSLLPTRAIDRIVPVGSALNFSAVWDGQNLLQLFCREVDLQ